MDLSEQVDKKINENNLKEQLEQLKNRGKILKNRRNLSMAAIHTGEVFLLASLVAFPVAGWMLGLAVLGIGTTMYGVGRLADKNIVNEYNETSEKIRTKSKELLDEEYKAYQAQKEDKKEKTEVKVLDKTAKAKKVVDIANEM